MKSANEVIIDLLKSWIKEQVRIIEKAENMIKKISDLIVDLDNKNKK